MKKDGKNKRFINIRRFLFCSVVFLAVLCIVVFSSVAGYVGKSSDDTINDLGSLYMSEMSKQLQQKFDAIVNLQMMQMEGIIQRTLTEAAVYGDEMKEELAFSSSIRGFNYLALYTKTGRPELIDGLPVEPIDAVEFQEVLTNDGKNITSGISENGERVILFSMSAEYPMADGEKSAWLIAGMPISYLEKALVMESEDSLIYYHIIRRDGSFVIRSSAAYRDNYFTRMREAFSEYNGMTPEDYVEELQFAMRDRANYTTQVLVEDEYRQLYCSSLEGTDWYLVAAMPYGVLTDSVMSLANVRQIVILAACGIILVAVLVIFIIYLRMSQRQMLELERAEAEAIHANKAKSEFLSNMSHDIRTPMNGIMGMTAIAMTNIDDKARLKDCLAKITLSGKHLLGLINDVLDMSKIESGKLSLNIDNLSLRDTIESIVNIIQPQVKEKGQHFDIFIRKIEAENVYCDSVRLNQVLINLLSNAVKYTQEGGRIHMELSQEPSPQGEAYICCHFSVKDNGIGMTPEFQKTIFESFTRENNAHVEKTEGAGLGMAITKCIVDIMGGNISVTSAPGKGSEFHVMLDLKKADVQETEMILPAWKMLVVDNNEDLCMSAVESLKEIGLDAEYALGGEEAVRKVEKCHGTRDQYQIILLDWKMPGMDGLQTTKEIRRRFGDETPILIISAYDWSDIEEEALEAGVNGFISKPLFKSNLYTGLSRYMLDEKEEEQKREQGVKKDFTGRRILLAEDNDINWEIAETILTASGFKVDRAENGKICVDTFRESELGYYDVILMDIRMPVMNGYDATEAIRALDRPDAGLPIIAMSADAFAADIQHSLDSGMNEHISKPIDVEKLIRVLEKYL